MNLVYKITFPNRQKNNFLPYCYIGSKTKSTFIEGVIYDKNNKPYWGSSTDESYQILVKSTEEKVVEILAICEDYKECREEENRIHKELDVVANVEYFNRSYASTNNYSMPDWGTFRHVSTGKCVKLPSNHHMVLSGEYVGVNTGKNIPEEEKKKHGLPGEKNPFFGKTHSEENRQKIKDGQQKWREENPEEYANTKKEASKRAVRTFKGVPKSEEQKKKMGRKGMVSYKNLNTGITIRMYKDSKEHEELDTAIWVPLVTYSKLTNTLKKICCVHCGIEGIPANIKRWHNDNCKHKKEN